MKTIWNRVTLMRYATEEDNGKIPPGGWLGSLLLALVLWATSTEKLDKQRHI